MKSFTLIESLVYIAIFTIVIIAIYQFAISFYNSNTFLLQQTRAISEGRTILSEMSREIKEMVNSENGDYPISNANVNNVIFYSDIDKDNNIEEIRWFLQGNILSKGIIETPGGNEIVTAHSENIRNNQIFTYYNSSNQLVPDLNILTDISLIEINLQVNVNPFAAPGDFTLKTIVKPRNLD